MIITEDQDKLHYIKKLMKEKYRHTYRMCSDGDLEYDGNCRTNKLLMYIDRAWYGSWELNQGASKGAMDKINKRKFLFAITENRYWQMRSDKRVEYASPAKPLSEDAVMFFMAVQKGTLCIYIIDGSKYKAPLMLGVSREPDTERIFAQSIIAMTQQYDPEAAKEMEEFWFAPPEPIAVDMPGHLCRWDPGIDPKEFNDDYPPCDD